MADRDVVTNTQSTTRIQMAAPVYRYVITERQSLVEVAEINFG